MSPGRMEGLDVDPEAVRAALRDFMTQLANAERERVSTHLLFKKHSWMICCVLLCMCHCVCAPLCITVCATVLLYYCVTYMLL